MNNALQSRSLHALLTSSIYSVIRKLASLNPKKAFKNMETILLFFFFQIRNLSCLVNVKTCVLKRLFRACFRKMCNIWRQMSALVSLGPLLRDASSIFGSDGLDKKDFISSEESKISWILTNFHGFTRDKQVYRSWDYQWRCCLFDFRLPVNEKITVLNEIMEIRSDTRLLVMVLSVAVGCFAQHHAQQPESG